MIEPMSKYTFMVYHREYNDFLEGLRNVGVVHIIERESGNIENPELEGKIQQLQVLNSTIKALKKRIADDQETFVSSKDKEAVLGEYDTFTENIENKTHELQALTKEINALTPWGDFDANVLSKLDNAGINIKFFVCSERQFSDEWLDKHDIEIVNEIGGNIYFVVVQQASNTADLDAEEVKLPAKSLSTLISEQKKLKKEIGEYDEKLDNMAIEETQVLEDWKTTLESEISFDKVVLNSNAEAENKLMVVEGWVPKNNESELSAYLEETGAYHEVAQAQVKDSVPIKLKNNRFARLFEGIGELYTLPDSKELDLTPFFAPFFMLFFGFCLGDAGYGLLILIATIIGRGKVKEALKPIMTLGMFLGISTVIMGIVGGTFFGIDLIKVEWKWISKYQQLMLDSNSLMYLALGLGYIQIVFGMFLKAANKIRIFGLKYSISQFGWIIIVLLAIPSFLLGYLEFIDKSLSTKLWLSFGILGAIPTLFYNTPGKNVFLNIGIGVWDTYGMASGLLGDLLSYIRLFALGISSAVLGRVFNQLAMDLSPDVPVLGQIVMILILAFGHSLNLFMAALGSFVHPLRLTFVEFYKNAGFMGGGKKYNPFKSN